MQNRSVLITGSSRGLGKALALVFASNGYEVILHGRDKENLSKVKEKVLEKGVSCYVSAGELGSDKVIRQLFEIAKEKKISVLINNAAMHCPHLPLEEISDEEIENILITNLVAPIKLTKKIYSFFLNKGFGTIININSISGLEDQELRSVYCASKWGLRGFTDSFRLEAEKNNVRVLGVYPSGIKTKAYFTFGMEPQEVAQKIYAAYKNISINEIKLDDRPKK